MRRKGAFAVNVKHRFNSIEIQLNRNHITQSVHKMERSLTGLRHDGDRVELEERRVDARLLLAFIHNHIV
jgi:hypothetical protein